MKSIRIISISILIIVAINALVAGYSFMHDPSGSGLHISTDRLKHSPFKDYFIPGLVLFVINGVFNLVAAVFILFRWKPYIIMLSLQGVMLSGWILVQVIMLQDFNILHGVFLAIGILLWTFAFILNKAATRSLT